MHYKNGTEAKKGDHVVLKRWNGEVIAGVISELDPCATTCNAMLYRIVPGMTCQEAVNLSDLYLAADAYAAIEPKVVTTPPPTSA